MSSADIHHFLVIYDIAAEKAEVREFGIDYDQALHAYNECEQQTRNEPNLEVVLLSAESRATIERTHSSYFESAQLDDLLLA